MPKPRKETKEDFYYNFPKAKFFIVRKLSGEWYHFYPRKDLELPQAFSSVSAAKKHLERGFVFKGLETKVVTGTQASKYPVPKRY